MRARREYAPGAAPGGVPDRVRTPARENLRGHPGVVPGMKQINESHVAVPGLAVAKVAAADDDTVFAIQELLGARCAIAPADHTTRAPGEPGVRLRYFLDLRQKPDA